MVLVLSGALAVAVVTAVLVSLLANSYYSELTRISPCDGGIGVAWDCPPAVGATIVQWGIGEKVAGAYSYRFLVAPDAPPSVNASSFTLEVTTSSTGPIVPLSNVTLSSPNGSLLAQYLPSAGIWSSNSTAPIWQVDQFTIVSSTNIAGDWFAFWDSAARDGTEGPLA